MLTKIRESKGQANDSNHPQAPLPPAHPRTAVSPAGTLVVSQSAAAQSREKPEAGWQEAAFPSLSVRTATDSKMRKGMDDVGTGHVRTNQRLPKEKRQSVKKRVKMEQAEA